jgi:shikimate dehydrogenase
MHNAALRKLKIKAKYKLFPLEEKRMKIFLSNLKKNNICGFNVTIPYKERILQYIDGYKADSVKAIRAANTVVIDKQNKFKLFNTDYLGFIRHIKDLKIKPRKVAIIGAGGASRAICFALGKKKAQEVVIYDIDKFRSLSIMKLFNQIFPKTRYLAAGSIEELKLAEKDLLINASSVGLKKSDPLIIPVDALHKDLFVYDLIYNPCETRLLQVAKDKGLRYSNGLGMLLYQGVEALNLWISPKKAPVELMRNVLEKSCTCSGKKRGEK